MSIFIVNGNSFNQISNNKQLTGEKIPGDLDSWDYFGTDPNEILKYNYDLLCQRSTTLYHTHAPVAGAINKMNTYAIGQGLVFRSQPDWQLLGMTQKQGKEWGMRFQKLVHYVFLMLNFYQKQSILFRTADIMGDSFLFFDRATPEYGMPFDIIETGGDQVNFQAAQKGDEKITLGIIHDDFLRRKGVVQNSTDQKRVYFKDENGDQNVIQFFNKLMARQLRGYPAAYRIIAAAKNDDRLWDATLARAVLESIILGVSNKTTSSLGSQIDAMVDTVKNESGYSPPTGISTTATASQLNPGNLFQLNGDGEINFTDLKTPSNNFDKFQNAYIEMVGMGMDVPPEVVKSMYSTSFTAHKGALNDFNKSYMQRRKNFIRTVCNTTLLEVAKYLFMENLIEMPNPQFFKNPVIQMATLAGNWLGPVPGHINPSQEVDALIKAKDNAFITSADAAAQYDNDWDDQIEEALNQWKQWNERNPEQQAAIMQKQEEQINSENQNKDDEVTA
jgi:capsid protein